LGRYGWCWWVRQDEGYEALGAYGQSVTIYPKDDVVIAVNAASRDPAGFGIARSRLLQALEAAAVGRPDPTISMCVVRHSNKLTTPEGVTRDRRWVNLSH
jgi:CubicO group peptidase (beta-lactamase class C family)